MTIIAERWLDEVILSSGLLADVAGAPIGETFLLPAGLGDVAIMSLHAIAQTVDVGPAAASTVPRGLRFMVTSSDGSTYADPVGSAAWYLCFDNANSLLYQAVVDPDALVLWRQAERLTMNSPELDSDATPTGDLLVIAKVVRVRPIEEQAPGPVRLVR